MFSESSIEAASQNTNDDREHKIIMQTRKLPNTLDGRGMRSISPSCLTLLSISIDRFILSPPLDSTTREPARMSRATKRKHVVRELLDDYPLPTEAQTIVRVRRREGVGRVSREGREREKEREKEKLCVARPLLKDHPLGERKTDQG